jgi:hypothetical protein
MRPHLSTEGFADVMLQVQFGQLPRDGIENPEHVGDPFNGKFGPRVTVAEDATGGRVGHTVSSQWVVDYRQRALLLMRASLQAVRAVTRVRYSAAAAAGGGGHPGVSTGQPVQDNISFIQADLTARLVRSHICDDVRICPSAQRGK